MFILHQGWCGPFVGSGLGHLSGDAGPVEVGKAWNCGGPQWKGEGGRGTKGRWRNKMMLSWNAAKRNYVGGKSRPTMVHFHKMWWHFSDVWIHLCFLLQNFRVRPPELVFWVPAWFFFYHQQGENWMGFTFSALCVSFGLQRMTFNKLHFLWLRCWGCWHDLFLQLQWVTLTPQHLFLPLEKEGLAVK